MSVRPKPAVPKWGSPLPKVFDQQNGRFLGHGIPVEGEPLNTSPEIEAAHALRARLSVPAPPKAAPKPALAVDAAGCAPSQAEQLEKAACEAARRGHLEILTPLIMAGVATATLVSPPLAAAALGQQVAAAEALVAAGARVEEAVAHLHACGEAAAAAWLERL